MKPSLFLHSLIILLTAGTLSAQGANYYYDMGRPTTSAWFGSNAWSLTAYGSDPAPVYNQVWENTASNNNVANFTSNATYSVALSGSTVNFGSGGINRIGTNGTLNITGGSLVFNGGTVNAGGGSSAVVSFAASTTVSGNFTLSGSSYLILKGTNAYSGTITVTSGYLLFDDARSSSTNSNITMNGGTLETRLGSAQSHGALQINGGNYIIGAINANTSVDATFTALSGTVGTIQLRGNSFNRNNKLTINQSTNTVYSGAVTGVLTQSGTTQTLALTKTGAGSLTLSGNTNLRGETTTISGGTLLINGASSKQFESKGGTTAISVASGGTLGGTSTMVIYGGDNVVVADGGALASGSASGAYGAMTLDFNTGGALDLSGVSSETGWLKFDLGAATTAGTTYDQLVVKNGVLNIGTGLLNIDDFAFNLLAGFGEGSYTLFSLTGTSTVTGSLGSSLGHSMGDGFYGTIALSGNDLVLNVAAVPEPSTVLLALGGVGALIAARRRKVLSLQCD